jgi:hypothetical protein
MTHTPLTKTEARMLTAKAVTIADALAYLLKQLHDGQAHKALGYATWSAYCAAHFDESLRTIQRYIRQERVREALAGSVNVSRFTNGALETLAEPDIDHMRQVADIAARSATGDIGKDVIKSVQAAITEMMNTGAVDIDGEQYAVGDALVGSVRSVLREDVLSKREYIVANEPVMKVAGGNGDNIVTITINMDDATFKDRLAYNCLQPVFISIWREQS